jgi:hypothetical protein
LPGLAMTTACAVCLLVFSCPKKSKHTTPQKAAAITVPHCTVGGGQPSAPLGPLACIAGLKPFLSLSTDHLCPVLHPCNLHGCGPIQVSAMRVVTCGVDESAPCGVGSAVQLCDEGLCCAPERPAAAAYVVVTTASAAQLLHVRAHPAQRCEPVQSACLLCCPVVRQQQPSVIMGGCLQPG